MYRLFWKVSQKVNCSAEEREIAKVGEKMMAKKPPTASKLHEWYKNQKELVSNKTGIPVAELRDTELEQLLEINVNLEDISVLGMICTLF